MTRTSVELAERALSLVEASDDRRLRTG